MANLFKKLKKDREYQAEMFTLIDSYNRAESHDIYTYDEANDKCIIFLDLANIEIYQSLSNESLLNPEIFDYIESVFKVIRHKNSDLEIQINYKEGTSEKEKEKIKSLLKLHYALNYEDAKKKMRHTNITAFVCLFIGAVILSVYAVAVHFDLNEIFREIIDIFAWVFVWESCDLLAFEKNEDRREKLRSFMLYKADLTEKE